MLDYDFASVSRKDNDNSAFGTNDEERMFVAYYYFPVVIAILAIIFPPKSDIVLHNLSLKLPLEVPFRHLLKSKGVLKPSYSVSAWI